MVRVVAERLQGEVIGYVVTFDDITALVMAERKAAWADVARRIAHEIKNPLTPIQLASERLKRKYSREIKSDPDTFVEAAPKPSSVKSRTSAAWSTNSLRSRGCRGPSSSWKTSTSLVRQAVFLERNRFPGIRIEVAVPEQPVELLCDSRQVSQALINVLKNAAEAVMGREGAKACLAARLDRRDDSSRRRRVTATPGFRR